MATPTSDLTPQQAKAAQYVREYQDVRGYGPSVRDVASWLAVSPPVALGHLRAAEAKGSITHDANVARSWRGANGR